MLLQGCLPGSLLNGRGKVTKASPWYLSRNSRPPPQDRSVPKDPLRPGMSVTRARISPRWTIWKEPRHAQFPGHPLGIPPPQESGRSQSLARRNPRLPQGAPCQPGQAPEQERHSAAPPPVRPSVRPSHCSPLSSATTIGVLLVCLFVSPHLESGTIKLENKSRRRSCFGDQFLAVAPPPRSRPSLFAQEPQWRPGPM